MSNPHLYEFPRWKTTLPVILAVMLIAITAILITYKVKVRGYRFVHLDEEPSWRVTLNMQIEAKDQDVQVTAMLPVDSTARQRVFDVYALGEGFSVTNVARGMQWRRDGFSGRANLVLRFRAQTDARSYSLPNVLDWENLDAAGMGAYLVDDKLIQKDHPEIRAKAEMLRQASDDVISFVRAAFTYVLNDVVYRKAGGPTDAITAFRLSEASCNGKNRLLISLARSQGIPARMCKGIILEQGVTKTESHAWTELYLNGQWVPFCPTSDYFAKIPASYLEFPKQDERMFAYSKNILFDRAFTIERSAKTPEEALREDLDNPDHILSAWGSLDEAQFSLSLLMVILTIPLGATLVSFVRNIIGFVPFGTFLPTLIAVSFRDTGLGWGLALFATTVVVGSIINEALKSFHLLHFPRLAIVLIFVVATILGLALLANHYELNRAAKVGMFPLAIMTLTIERFSMTVEQESLKSALKRLLMSLLVASLCYFLMTSFHVRSAFLVFPELLLACISINLLIGVYTGLRLTEYFRFKTLIPGTESIP